MAKRMHAPAHKRGNRTQVGHNQTFSGASNDPGYGSKRVGRAKSTHRAGGLRG